jgi:hypothetical protein
MYVVLQRGMQYWLIDYTKSTYRTTEVRYLWENPRVLLTFRNMGEPSFCIGPSSRALCLVGVRLKGTSLNGLHYVGLHWLVEFVNRSDRFQNKFDRFSSNN